MKDDVAVSFRIKREESQHSLPVENLKKKDTKQTSKMNFFVKSRFLSGKTRKRRNGNVSTLF